MCFLSHRVLITHNDSRIFHCFRILFNSSCHKFRILRNSRWRWLFLFNLLLLRTYWFIVSRLQKRCRKFSPLRSLFWFNFILTWIYINVLINWNVIWWFYRIISMWARLWLGRTMETMFIRSNFNDFSFS